MVRELGWGNSVEQHFTDLCYQEEAVVAVVAYLFPRARVIEYGSKGRRRLDIESDGHIFDVASDADLMIFLPDGVNIMLARKRLDQELDRRRAGSNVEELIYDPGSISWRIFWGKIAHLKEEVELYNDGRFSLYWRESEFRPALPPVVADDGR